MVLLFLCPLRLFCWCLRVDGYVLPFFHSLVGISLCGTKAAIAAFTYKVKNSRGSNSHYTIAEEQCKAWECVCPLLWAKIIIVAGYFWRFRSHQFFGSISLGMYACLSYQCLLWLVCQEYIILRKKLVLGLACHEMKQCL